MNLDVAQDAAITTLPKEQLRNLKVSFIFSSQHLETPLAKDQVVGTINFSLDGNLIEQRSLVVMKEIKENDIFSTLWN